MDNKYIKMAELSEERAIKMISLLGLKAEKNNLNNYDIDLLINKKLVDVQFSFNFNKYGDIRIDILSAFFWKSKEDKNIFYNNVKSSNNLKDLLSQTVHKNFKLGKYFDKNNMDGVFYFIYNGEKPKNLNDFKNRKIDKIVYLPSDIVKREIVENWNYYRYKYKINNKSKNKLNEKHESSFIPINLDTLVKKYKIPVAKNKKEFIELVGSYMNRQLNNKKRLKYK